MKTYTEHEINGLSIYVDDETGKVHHAVNWNSPNQTTLYPYAYNTRSRVWECQWRLYAGRIKTYKAHD